MESKKYFGLTVPAGVPRSWYEAPVKGKIVCLSDTPGVVVEEKPEWNNLKQLLRQQAYSNCALVTNKWELESSKTQIERHKRVLEGHDRG